MFALIYKVGFSSGHAELIGLYETKEMAMESQRYNMHLFPHKLSSCYSIKEIPINTDVNIVFAEW